MPTAHVDMLIRMGLAKLVDHPTHRPGKVVRLTDTGATATREQLRAAWAREREDYRQARRAH